ncbi:MAG: hypothetical protein HC898_02935, partial [Phycisphaerales bacterium]|nr:hypothetical protein [Phycisphaerales bacterium]
RVYNLGSDHEISIEQLADMVITQAQSRSVKKFVPYQQAANRGVDDPLRRVPDLSRLRLAIGFTPRFGLEDTLTDLIAAARDAGIRKKETPIA